MIQRNCSAILNENISLISWHSNFEIIPDLSSEKVARRSFYFQMSIGVCRHSSPLSLEKTSAHSQYFYDRSPLFFTTRRVFYSKNKKRPRHSLKFHTEGALQFLFCLSCHFFFRQELSDRVWQRLAGCNVVLAAQVVVTLRASQKVKDRPGDRLVEAGTLGNPCKVRNSSGNKVRCRNITFFW